VLAAVAVTLGVGFAAWLAHQPPHRTSVVGAESPKMRLAAEFESGARTGRRTLGARRSGTTFVLRNFTEDDLGDTPPIEVRPHVFIEAADVVANPVF
jgi:hypothetical protein